MAKTTEIKTKDSNPWLGILPWIGVILFVITSVPILLGDRSGDWQRQLLINGVTYMIGWAGVGAGISHIFFGKQISKSIGFQKTPYELEVGFADLSFGIVGLMASGQPEAFWLAIILVSGFYRIGCGIGHIRQIIQAKNYAINNTAILFLNFVVPAFLIWTYYAWR